jgi:hypothetical protein
MRDARLAVLSAHVCIVFGSFKKTNINSFDVPLVIVRSIELNVTAESQETKTLRTALMRFIDVPAITRPTSFGR